MRSGVFIFILSLLLALSFLQGISQGSETQERRNTFNLSGRLIHNTTKAVYDISVMGNIAAWTEWNNDDPDVWSYNGGTVKILAGTHYVESHPSVGEITVWEESDSNSSRIMSTEGLIYSGDAHYPDVDGRNVVFLDGTTVMGKINGNILTIATTNYTTVQPHISGNYVVFENYAYSISEKKKWIFFNTGFSGVDYSDISGDWAIVMGRGNFGKSIFIYAVNLETGSSVRVWNGDVGQYSYLDSISMDNNLIVWTIGGVGYLYNLVTMNLSNYYVSSGELRQLVVGGGKLMWSVHNNGEYEIYIGDAPRTDIPYVEVTLKNGGGVDSEVSTLLVWDSSGKRLGYDAKYTEYREISGGMIISSGTTYTYRLTEPGTYYYDVMGKENGKYTLTIRRYGTTRSSEYLEVNADNISISAGEIQRYIVSWDKLAKKEMGAVEIKFDKMGDGTFDSSLSFSTGNIDQQALDNGGSSEFYLSIGGMACMAIIAIVSAGIILIVLLLRRRKSP